MADKIAVVTGANKGIGLAIVKALCQQFEGIVYLTSRSVKNGEEAVENLKKLGYKPVFHQLDVSNHSSVQIFKEYITKRHGGLDILINNAGIVNHNATYEDAKDVIDINYRSILTVKELLFPLLRQNARVINISSDCGHLSNLKNKYWIERLSNKNLTVDDVNEFVEWYLTSIKNGTFNKGDFVDNAVISAYRVSKIALSAITIIYQKEFDKDSRNISTNSMHPGLVRTEMTSEVGFYSIDEAAKVPIYLALEAPQSLKGQYIWFDGRVLDWYNHNADYWFKSATLSKK